MANGFFPVSVEFPLPVPTRLLVPDDLSLSLIILLAIGLDPGVPVLGPVVGDDPLLLVDEDVLLPELLL